MQIPTPPSKVSARLRRAAVAERAQLGRRRERIERARAGVEAELERLERELAGIDQHLELLVRIAPAGDEETPTQRNSDAPQHRNGSATLLNGPAIRATAVRLLIEHRPAGGGDSLPRLVRARGRARLRGGGQEAAGGVSQPGQPIAGDAQGHVGRRLRRRSRRSRAPAQRALRARACAERAHRTAAGSPRRRRGPRQAPRARPRDRPPRARPARGGPVPGAPRDRSAGRVDSSQRSRPRWRVARGREPAMASHRRARRDPRDLGDLGTATRYLPVGCAMATARARSDARNGASRLATTVAREIELLATRRERLRERQQALRAQLDDLADQLGELDSRRRDLDRLLGRRTGLAGRRAAPADRWWRAAPARRRAPARLRPARRHPLPRLVRAARRGRADRPRGRSGRDLLDQRRTVPADRARRTTRDLPARSPRRPTHRDPARQGAQSPAPHDRDHRRPR